MRGFERLSKPIVCAHCDALIGTQFSRNLCRLGARILDGLRFIEYRDRPAPFD